MANLERNQSSIWAAIRDLQARNSLSKSTGKLPSHEQFSQEQSLAPQCQVNDDDDDDDNDAEDDDTDESEDVFPSNAPSHLLHLFDNSLLNSNGHQSHHDNAGLFNLSSTPQKVQACAALRALTPSHADMTTIASYASSWLPLYASLFSMASTSITPEAMRNLHNELQHRDDPVALATLLLFIAMTVQHAPATASFPTSESMQDLSTFVKNVSDTVEHIVIADDALAGTIEGLEAALLFLRL